MFSKDDASPSLTTDQARAQSTFGSSTSAVLFPGRQTAQPDTSNRNLSVVLTSSSRSVSTLPGVPGHSVQRPSIQVCLATEYSSLADLVRGPYCKLRTEVFPSFIYGPITKREFKRKARGIILCEHISTA